MSYFYEFDRDNALANGDLDLESEAGSRDLAGRWIAALFSSDLALAPTGSSASMSEPTTPPAELVDFEFDF